MAENEEVVVKSKSSNIVLIMVISLLLVILIVGSALIFLLMQPPQTAASAEAAGAATAQQESGKGAESSKQKGASTSIGVIYTLESFTVNLSSEAGSKFLKTTLNMEQNVPELTPELDKKKPMIMDVILSILSSKSAEEIITTKGKERLKEDLIQKINEKLDEGYIKNIFFTDFIISS